MTDLQKNILTFAGVGAVAYGIYYLTTQYKKTADNVSNNWLQQNRVTPKIKSFAKLINEKVSGPNILYYPEVINEITALTVDELRQLNTVWQTYYSSLNDGLSLRMALEEEDYYNPYTFFTEHGYQPAIDYLRLNGY